MAPFKKSRKNTSFGKRSDAEKTFRGKKKTDRGGSSYGDKKSPRSARPTRSEGDRPFRSSGSGSDFKKPFGRREGGDRRDSRSSGGGFSRPSRGEGRGDSPRPFGKSRSTGSFNRPGKFDKSSRPDRSEGGFKKPYRKDEEGGFKKPFEKKEGVPERPRRFSKPFRSEEGEGFKKPIRSEEGEGFKKPFRSEEGEGIKKPIRSGEGEEFKKPAPPAGRPFRKTENFGKPYKKEYKKREGGEDSEFHQKSFVQKRVAPLRRSDFVKVTGEVKEKDPDAPIRLNKFISNSGVCSRREADNLISMGLITVNGKSVTEMGHKIKPGDEVRYEGKLLKAEKPVYILLNKPKGFITTTDDPQERNTVMSLVAKACKERVYPVGRLDRNTTGLLLLTNDGELTDKLTHPSYNVKKIYKAELDRPLTKNDFQKIADGVQLEEGRAMVDDVALVSDDGKTVGLEIHIGWNRIVRRIFESLGYEVVRLDRSVYAGLDKKDLGRGEWRFLKPEEIVRLKHFK